jgi:hypothetical protein
MLKKNYTNDLYINLFDLFFFNVNNYSLINCFFLEINISEEDLNFIVRRVILSPGKLYDIINAR